jgi:hypothetical protein
MVISCKKDKPEPPTPPVVIEAPEPPPAPVVDTIPEPPAPEVVKVSPKPVVKKKKKKIANKKPEDYKALTFNVQLGINPDRKNWVLFKNGTYMIFPNNTAEKDAIRAAKKLMSNYKGGSITIQKSSFAKGWIASTGAGIYNYIDRGAFGRGIPKEANILKKGKDNLTSDTKGLEIVYINGPK